MLFRSLSDPARIRTTPGQGGGDRRRRGARRPLAARVPERKSVVKGKSVSVRVDLGGRRIIKKKIVRERPDQIFSCIQTHASSLLIITFDHPQLTLQVNPFTISTH